MKATENAALVEIAAKQKGCMLCGRLPSVPSIVINERIGFDPIPDMEALTTAVRGAIAGSPTV